MRIFFRIRRIDDADSVRTYAERRLHFSLGRFAAHIERVLVQLEDVNGPRGGVDKVCQIAVRLRPSGTVFVEESDGDVFAGVARAVERTGQAVSRALSRSREARRATRSVS